MHDDRTNDRLLREALTALAVLSVNTFGAFMVIGTQMNRALTLSHEQWREIHAVAHTIPLPAFLNVQIRS
jgi:hypothetical protein